MDGLFFYSKLITPDTIDANKHVNNLVYLKWMQDIATKHSTTQGWSFEKYQETQTTWVIRSHFIEYIRPSYEGETLIHVTWIHDFGVNASKRKYFFLRESDKKVVAKAETNWVYLDAKTGKPTPIPDSFKSCFTLIPDDNDVLHFFISGKSNPL